MAQTVRDLMVRLEDYAVVSEEATLREAVEALAAAQAQQRGSPYPHRAILVSREPDGQIVGKISQWAALRGLEPKYAELVDDRRLARFGISPEYTRAMMQNHHLLQKPLDDICQIAAGLKAKDVMVAVGREAWVAADASLNEAIHRFVVEHHQSLLVAEGEEVVGVLRLSDLFGEVCRRIGLCRP